MSHGDDTSIRGLVRILLRGLLPAAGLAVVAAALVYVVSSNMPPVYTSTATILASNASPGLARFDVVLAAPPPIDLVAYRSLATSQAVFDRARLELDDPARLDEVQISSTSEIMHLSSIIRIHARAHEPEAAAEAANAMARALVEWDRQRSKANLAEIVAALEQQVTALADTVVAMQTAGQTDPEQLEGQMALLSDRQQQLALARAMSASVVVAHDIVEHAVAPIAPIAPLPRSYAVIAFLGVLFVAFGFSLLAQALDTSVRSSDEVARLTGLPVYAEFRNIGGRTRVDAKGLSFLRASLDLAADEGTPTVVVTSPLRLASTTILASELATTFAEDADRTLLVVADGVGIADGRLDSGVAAAAHAVVSAADAGTVEPVRVLTHSRSGHEVRLDVLAGHVDAERPHRELRRLLDGWRASYDAIVVDAPPLLDAADVLALGRFASSVVLVVDVARVTRAQLREVAALLERGKVGVAGLAVIARTSRVRSGQRRRRTRLPWIGARAPQPPVPVRREFPEGF